MKKIFAIFIILNFMLTGCSTYHDKKLSDKTVFSEKLIRTHEQPCKIKYHELNSLYRNIIVEGNLGINARKYPVVLDTGSSQPVVLNAALVRKNNLPVYDSEICNTDFNGKQLGTCHLSRLDIGEVILEKWPCIYFESNSGLNLFGIPIASSTYGKDNIILGLPLLREFKYVIFDDINKEAELSYHKSFEPHNTEIWKKYPISIEEDFHGNAFLFVRLSVAGYETELQLDTGSGKGMAIGERLWNEFNKNLEKIKLKEGKDIYPYIGNLPCKKGEISRLEFGNRTINNAEISVFSDDCPLLDGCEGLVGMQYFSNTVFVLDFEHDLMWLREDDTFK
jgi:hypothetical protein